MDKNAHYLVVGLFVIVATIAGLMFAGWLYKDHEPENAKRYEIQFANSVDGLARGSDVRFMGIKVGQVEKTHLIPNKPDRVGVVISIKEDTPVTSDTVATLRLQGITGISYINLVQKPKKENKEFVIDSFSNLPILETAPSSLGGVLQALPQLQEDLNHLITNANKALNQENLKTFSAILENMNHLILDANKVFSEGNMKNLASLLKNISDTAAAGPALIADLRKTTTHLNKLVGNMDRMVSNNQADLKGSVKDLRKTLQNISKMTNHYSRLAVQLNKMTTNNREQVNELLSDGSHELKQLLIESRRTAKAVRQLAEKLEKNPSRIIYESTTQGVKIPQ